MGAETEDSPQTSEDKPRSNVLSVVEVTGNFAQAPTNIGNNVYVNNATDASGNIVATFGNKAHNNIHGTTLTYKRDADGMWTCEIKGSDKYKTKYIPANCSNK